MQESVLATKRACVQRRMYRNAEAIVTQNKPWSEKSSDFRPDFCYRFNGLQFFQLNCEKGVLSKFGKKFMEIVNLISGYLPRIAYSGILVFLSAIFLVELLRVWTDERLYLAPFEYEREGVAQAAAGETFTRRVGQSLRRIRFIYTGAGEAGTPIASTDNIDRSLNLELPELAADRLQGIEVTAYGINFGNLLNSIRGRVRDQNLVVGYVSYYQNKVDVHATVQGEMVADSGPVSGTGLNLGWSIQASSEGDAAFELGCGIYRMIAATESEIFRTLTDGEFCDFLRALETYQEYRAILPKNLPIDEKQKKLNSAMELVAPLEGAQFPYINKLAGMIYRETGELEKAEFAFIKYLSQIEELKQTDENIVEITDALQSAKIGTTATPSPDGVVHDGKLRSRPLTVGVSIGSDVTAAGTLCCLVHDRQGTNYFLTADHVVADSIAPAANIIGRKVIQPGSMDGGRVPTDVIGEVAQFLRVGDTDGQVGGALIKLAEGVIFDSTIPGVEGARISDVTQSVRKGEEVYSIGRTSGFTQREVLNTNVSTNVATGSSVIRMQGLISMTAGGSSGGDSGAPVFNKQNQLVGMVYAGSATETLVMPIQPILDALQVSLTKAD